jgi:hypothetical protein
MFQEVCYEGFLHTYAANHILPISFQMLHMKPLSTTVPRTLLEHATPAICSAEKLL